MGVPAAKLGVVGGQALRIDGIVSVDVPPFAPPTKAPSGPSWVTELRFPQPAHSLPTSVVTWARKDSV
jgi:hypothetical protein